MYNNVASALANKADKYDVVTSINNRKGSFNITNTCSTDLRGAEPSALSGHLTTYFGGSEGNDIYLYDGYVKHDGQYLKFASLPSNCERVENDFMYDSSNSIVGQIKPERFISGFYANQASGLTSWVGDMLNLKIAFNGSDGLFARNENLSTFIGDLSSLTDGRRMFYECNALTTFIGDLSSLENGMGMFNDTQLSVESVEIIADTLPEITNSATITVDFQTPPSSTTELTAYMTAMTPIVDKGWVLDTNPEIANLFNTTKYTINGGTV